MCWGTLPRVSSDHTPILINTTPTNLVFGKKPFRLETMWLKDPSFPNIVQDSWQCFPNDVILAIKDFTARVTTWNREVFGNIFFKKKRLLARPSGIQRSIALNPCSTLLDLEKSLTDQFQQILFLEEEFWALKSRLQWSNFGDRNTSFFHLSTICRRQQNKIWCLKDTNGEWSSSKLELSNIIRSHFLRLYTTGMTYSSRAPSFQMNCLNLSIEEKSTLDRPLCTTEIKNAIFSFKPQKAPGPDGLHPIFFQQFWSTVGDSTCKLIQEIFQKSTMPADLNETLICLIPKVKKPESVHQFRPIGLCNTIYKTVTKILVLRLKSFLNNLIHPLQASFIPGRKASDNVIVVQEIIHSMTTSRSKVGAMALKIDLEKAYDRLEWSFIRRTLQFFNFPTSWIDLIMSCISSSSLSILVNGERLESFHPSRGIRQGDPISPYIFILCMEYLSYLIDDEVSQGNWKGVKTSRNGPTFTHLFFADDLILFAKATRRNCDSINKVLKLFCENSGQSISLNKSKIFLPQYLDHNNFGFLEEKLGLKLSKSFGKYLGVPIIVNGRDKRAFDFIIERVREKLAGWKARTLSLAGRCTLIQAVTTAIPTHLMQCTMLPGKICKELDKLNRNFLWGESSDRRKLHLLNWQNITRPKDEGGLGIKHSEYRNKALLAKRSWSLLMDSKEIWANVLRKKYLNTQASTRRYSSVWKSLKTTKEICGKGTGWLVRNGKTIDFWHDNWLQPGTLRSLIHGPLSAHEKNLKVCDLWDEQGNWNLTSLSFNLPMDISKTILASPKPLSPSEEDCRFWKPSNNGQFNSSSAYRIACNIDSVGLASSDWKWLWKINSIPRVVFFLWLACHDRLPTKSMLLKRKIVPDDSCPLCTHDKESLLHILRDCDMVKPVWTNLNTPLPSDFFSPSSIKTWIHEGSTSSFHTTSLHGVHWRDLFPLICWYIWTARNKTVMEGTPFQAQDVLKKAKAFAVEFFFSISPVHNQVTKSNTLIGWLPPPSGFMKLNTDGSVLGNPGKASAGGLLRDSNGKWIHGFAHNLGITNSLAAELWGLRDGLLLARNLNITKLIIEIDAKSVVDLLHNAHTNQISSHPYSALINDCRCLMLDFETATIHHAHRESNYCADILAKEGHRLLDHIVYFVFPPHFVESQLMADIWGVSYPRLL
jgi:ribonuclease HI